MSKIKILIIIDTVNIPSVNIRLTDLFDLMPEVEYSIIETYKKIVFEDVKNIIWNADILIFQRAIDPVSKSFLDLVLKLNKAIIYDIDDNLLEIPKNFLLSIPQSKRICEYFLQKSNYVVTSTERLKNAVLPYNKSSVVIENSIQLDLFPEQEKNHNSTINILLSNQDHLKLEGEKENFINLLKSYLENKNIHIYLYGSLADESLLNYKNFHYRSYVHPRLNYIKDISTLNIDFALVPLEESYYHSFKSIIKFIDFAALSIPAIFSKVHPYIESRIEDHENGILVQNRIEEWKNAMNLLIEDQNKRLKLSQNAYNTCKNYYDSKIAIQSWKNIFSELVYSNTQSTNISYEDYVKNLNTLLIRVNFTKFFHILKLGLSAIFKITTGTISIRDLYDRFKKYFF